MKSETLVKIKENRRKYILEISNQKAETKHRLKKETIKDKQIAVSKSKKSDPKFMHPEMKNFVREKVKLIIKICKTGIELLRTRFKEANNYLNDLIKKRTEKTRDRIFSFFVILFDA